MAIIGIDLGTTNSLVTVWKNGQSILIPNTFGHFLTPSVVSIDHETIYVGEIAKERLITHPKETAGIFKRFMGSDKIYTLGKRRFRPEELSAFILKKLKEDAEAFLKEPVAEAVVSVPAYFNDAQRSATKRAGELAGLKVERLVNEPSAAALACQLMNAEEDANLLVFDFGGGTLDVSLVECFDNVINVLAVSGDNRLGGSDFDRLLARYFCQEKRLDFEALNENTKGVLLQSAEKCKFDLTDAETAKMTVSAEELHDTLPISREQFIEIAAPLFTRLTEPIKKVLIDGSLSLDEIDQVVLVGGSCKMPVVKLYVNYVLGKEADSIGSPDTIVALGTGAYAGIKARHQDIRDILLTDICPFSLGVNIVNPLEHSRDLMSVLIERNTTLPASRTGIYCTASDFQSKIELKVYQGEGRYADENSFLGKLDLPVPRKPKGQETVDVRFTYDINGILVVEATALSTKNTKSLLLIGDSNTMDKHEIEKKVAALQKYKIHPKDKDENRLLLARGDRLFTQTVGELRKAVEFELFLFSHALESQKTHAISKARERFSYFLDQVSWELENGGFGPSLTNPDENWYQTFKTEDTGDKTGIPSEEDLKNLFLNWQLNRKKRDD